MLRGAFREKFLAEGEGFEPPEVLPSMVFKTTAIGRSAIPPQNRWKGYCQTPEDVNSEGAKGEMPSDADK